MIPREDGVSDKSFRAVIAIVDERLTSEVVDVVRRVGGQAITVMRGRGRNLVSGPMFFGVPVESQRELLFLVVEADRAHEVAREVHRVGDLDRPGRGIVLVFDLDQVLGFMPRAMDLPHETDSDGSR